MIDISPDQFDSTVLQASGPVLVYVTASWCGPCKALRPVIEEFEKEVVGATIVRVDVDTCRTLATGTLGVRGVPALIAYRDGVETARHSGVANKQKLSELLGL